jgi:F0F1-type ATP synthase membrane subunit c/vacuolar-type H+-ATPase subunit K
MAKLRFTTKNRPTMMKSTKFLLSILIVETIVILGLIVNGL